MITVYGIRQCDTCRKALKWLEARDIAHRFHDFRANGLNRNLLAGWLASPFANQLLNRRSTSWCGLSGAEKQSAGDDLLQLLLDHPTLIKRPVFEDGTILAIGFKTGELESVLGGLK